MCHQASAFRLGPGPFTGRSHLSVSGSGWAGAEGLLVPRLGLRGRNAAETRALPLGQALAGAFAPRPGGWGVKPPHLSADPTSQPPGPREASTAPVP